MILPLPPAPVSRIAPLRTAAFALTKVPMKIEVLNTGSELLLGQVLNTHLGYISGQLLPLGQRIGRQATLPDGPAIREALEESWNRADLVILTGGLGPTSDDLTRDILSDLFQVPLEYHADLHDQILAYFAGRKLVPPDSVRVQALVPRGAVPLPNHFGTAPGLYLERGGKHLFCLPGPPKELWPMFENQVMPVLRRLVPESAALNQKVWKVLGLGESMVQDMVEAKLREFPGIEIGYCARPGEVDLRLMSSSLPELLAAGAVVGKVLGSWIYAEDGATMEETVVRLATAKGKTLTTAESCTGGLVAHRLTNIPGSSNVLLRGWVTYSNQSKIDEVGVKPATLKAHGAVSRETAAEMAQGALRRSMADLALSLTGIAGPGGGSAEKPVGLVYIGLARLVEGQVRVEVVEKRLVQPREMFKHLASQYALDLARRALLA